MQGHKSNRNPIALSVSIASRHQDQTRSALCSLTDYCLAASHGLPGTYPYVEALTGQCSLSYIKNDMQEASGTSELEERCGVAGVPAVAYCSIGPRGTLMRSYRDVQR